MDITGSFGRAENARVYSQYMDLARIAVEMQQAGWRVDRRAVQKHLADATARQLRFGSLFQELSGVDTLGEDGQTQAVKDYFWKTLGVPVVSIDKKTKKPKLDAAALLAYATEFDNPHWATVSAALYGFRKAGKTISFCTDYDRDRVHSAFNVTGTKGSRWSSNGPNIQQLPSKTVFFDFGKGPEIVAASIKDMLVSDEGFVLVDADYAALELYLQTYLTGATKLLGWIDEGADLHINNAIGMKLAPPGANKKTHKIHREVAKLAYGFAYNCSDHIAQVHKQMKGKMPEMTELMCKTLRSRYFALHPEKLRWQKSTMEQVQQQGYIETPLMGRRLYVESSPRGYNQALNGQAQITGGDLMNFAIIGLRKELRWAEGEQIRAQVHDSLVLQTRPEWVTETAAKVVKHMTAPVDIYGLTAKFVAEPGVGVNWRDMIDIKDWESGKRP